jgi:hypothetical protein
LAGAVSYIGQGLYQGCHTGRPEAFRRANRAGGRAALSITPYMNQAGYCRQKLLFQIYFIVVTFLTISRRRGHVEDGSLRWMPMEVCRRPFDPFIYHGRSVNARLTLIGWAQRAYRAGGRSRRAARPTNNPGLYRPRFNSSWHAEILGCLQVSHAVLVFSLHAVALCLPV